MTARVACSGIQSGSVRILVDVLSWRREFRTAGKRERERERHFLGSGPYPWMLKTKGSGEVLVSKTVSQPLLGSLSADVLVAHLGAWWGWTKP